MNLTLSIRGPGAARAARPARWWAAVAISSAGCFAPRDGSADDYEEEDLPSGMCETESSSSTGCEVEPLADECSRSGDCTNGAACVAEFDGEIGYFECRSECIDVLDESRWCTDDASCCDPAARCLSRGYCVVETEGGSSSSTEDSGSSTDASSDSGGSETTGGTE